MTIWDDMNREYGNEQAAGRNKRDRKIARKIGEWRQKRVQKVPNTNFANAELSAKCVHNAFHSREWIKQVFYNLLLRFMCFHRGRCCWYVIRMCSQYFSLCSFALVRFSHFFFSDHRLSFACFTWQFNDYYYTTCTTGMSMSLSLYTNKPYRQWRLVKNMNTDQKINI